jgi:hypothetical protein
MRLATDLPPQKVKGQRTYLDDDVWGTAQRPSGQQGSCRKSSPLHSELTSVGGCLVLVESE